MKKQVAIIHYNTPELTEAAILSLRKQTGMRYDVTVFDNSDKRPFKAKMQGVKVIDNTKGKYIDFGAELAKYPNKCWELAWRSNYGSAKHIICRTAEYRGLICRMMFVIHWLLQIVHCKQPMKFTITATSISVKATTR